MESEEFSYFCTTRLILMTIDYIQHTTEFQIFDRKSAKIDAKGLAVILIAFANADGGTVALGVEDDGKVTGIDGMQSHINDLLRASFDYCVPSIHTSPEYMEVTDYKGQRNHIILMRVAPSTKVHANQADEVFYRVGDKSKKLNFEQRTHLMYAKGERLFEDAPVQNAKMDDLDMALVEDYLKKIDYQKGAEAFIRENDFLTQIEDFRGGTKEYLTGAAVLLFGKNPQKFFPRARTRFIRYEGVDEKVGAEMNVIKDVTFEGTILNQVKKTIEFIETQVREHTFLGQHGQFVTRRDYPEFVIQEMTVNSVCHRAYSIKGTEIQIKMFDDRLVFESPGKLPGMVKPTNIRNTHFSRNAKTAAFL
jgi:ATP-dependent DNA helicase RecG